MLLAVVLRHLESAKVLLKHGANVLAVDTDYWSVSDEATSNAEPDFLRLVLQYRHFQLMQIADDTVPKVLSKLRSSPDFYVEMAWSFSSWIPFVSNMLPSDTYKIYKSANAVRVDTSLIGYENRKWKRGHISMIFKIQQDKAMIIEINHTARIYSISDIEIHKPPPSPLSIKVSPDELSFRLTNPVVSTYLDVDAISFERSRAGGFLGLFGSQEDKVEAVSDYPCKVYSASDVKLVSQKRTEHLLKEDKKKKVRSSSEQVSTDASHHERKFASMLSAAVKRNVEVHESAEDLENVSEEQYFNRDFPLNGKSLGRPREVSKRVQRFHATLWMSDQFPLSLHDQILPILDLLAQRQSHVKKLRDFITSHLPAGFPVKIDLPLYYVLTATVQQLNVHATVSPVEGVNTFVDKIPKPNPTSAEADLPIRTASETTFCAIDESVFEIPAGFRQVADINGGGNTDFLSSTVEATIDNHQRGSTSVFSERLVSNVTSTHAPNQDEEDAQLEVALAMSMESSNVPSSGPLSDDDRVLQAALNASLNESSVSEAARLAAQEEADLAAALALSMKEK